MIRSTERACFLRPRLNPLVKLYPSLATGRSGLPLWGRPAPCRLPPGCSSPWEGHWDRTWAPEALLPSACLTDIVFDDLGLVTFHTVQDVFHSCLNFSVYKTLAGGTIVCLSVLPCIFLPKLVLVNLRLPAPLITD